MKRRLAMLAVSVLFSAFTASAAMAEEPSTFTVDAGYRVDELQWNIAGNTSGTNPNILSELTWTDLEIFQVRGKAKTDFGTTYLRTSFAYGWITDGDNQDSDYDNDNRGGEFSRSNNATDGDNVWDLSIGLGINLNRNKDRSFKFNPIFGYSYHRQNLRITNGNQTIATPGRTPAVGPFSGLDSTYEARWYGPFGGLDMSYHFSKLKLHTSAEFHLVRYYAEADWNLRSDFAHPKSFDHEANGGGFIVDVSAEYAFNENWSVVATAETKRFLTDEGRDRTYFSDGTTADTQLNEVKWDSDAATLGIRYSY